MTATHALTHRSLTLTLLCACAGALALACGDDDVGAGGGAAGGGGSGGEGAAPPRELEVPTDPIELPADTRCVARRPGEQLLSVSPEGHAWLAIEASGPTVRVLDAFDGGVTEVDAPIELTQIAELRAWSGADATVVAAEGFFRLQNLERIELEPPEGASTFGSFCGHPSYSGRLLSAGTLFERRVDGWWSWAPAEEASQPLSALVTVDGECVSGSDASWLLAADGSLSRLDAARFTTAMRFGAVVGAAASGASVAVLADDRFFVGPEAWQAWRFASGVPSALAAAEGFAWLSQGDRLLRFDLRATTDRSLASEQERWRALSTGSAGDVEVLGAHATGAWTVHAGEVCHHAVAPALRISGLRPNQRSLAAEASLELRTPTPSSAVQLLLDGASVTLGADPDDPARRVVTLPIPSIGWHSLEVRVAGERARVFDVKRLPEAVRSWESDVQPLYAAGCAGSTCHATGNEFPVDLSTYDAWVSRAQLIRLRVVQGRNMPPASHSSGWGEDEITIVSEWLEGGMNP